MGYGRLHLAVAIGAAARWGWERVTNSSAPRSHEEEEGEEAAMQFGGRAQRMRAYERGFGTFPCDDQMAPNGVKVGAGMVVMVTSVFVLLATVTRTLLIVYD